MTSEAPFSSKTGAPFRAKSQREPRATSRSGCRLADPDVRRSVVLLEASRSIKDPCMQALKTPRCLKPRDAVMRE